MYDLEKCNQFWVLKSIFEVEILTNATVWDCKILHMSFGKFLLVSVVGIHVQGPILDYYLKLYLYCCAVCKYSEGLLSASPYMGAGW